MNDEKYDYEVECQICDSTTVITVIDIDEKPSFCPMCGEELVDD